jgi:hypothetical protein
MFRDPSAEPGAKFCGSRGTPGGFGLWHLASAGPVPFELWVSVLSTLPQIRHNRISSGSLKQLHCVASFGNHEDTMLRSSRPTPTCTRFKSTVEMPCIKCGVLMRLALIEPRNQQFDLLTYLCVPCDSGESFLKAM